MFLVSFFLRRGISLETLLRGFHILDFRIFELPVVQECTEIAIPKPTKKCWRDLLS